MKMKEFKIIATLFFILFAAKNGFSQANNKEVTITSSGSGKTLEDAKQAALRSATEQAFGAFISSKTEMFNDQVVADQMSSVSSGNIKSYEVLNESQLPDMRWGVTLKTIVSVDKLTSFVQARGINIEVQGGLFAINIKQQLLNEQGEINTITDMIGLLHESFQSSFDYTIKSSDPKSLDAESKNWEIPLEIISKCNKNIDFCANYLSKTLSAISLKEDEVQTYTSLKKQVYTVTVNHNGNSQKIYLRKQSSIDAINSLTQNWEFYVRNFVVNSGENQFIGKGQVSNLHKFSERVNSDYEYELYGIFNDLIIRFPTQGNTVGTFSYDDKKTLSQIEKISGYLIKPRGVVSMIKNGGYVIYDPIEGGYKIGIGVQEKKVTYVSNEFPAYYDFKIGDEIVSINGKPYENFDQIKTAMLNFPKGNVIMNVKRGEDVVKIKVMPRYIQPREGLVLAIYDIRNESKPAAYGTRSVGVWKDAKKVCEDSTLNGFDDWRLPSKNELQLIFDNFYSFGLGGLIDGNGYWSGDSRDDSVSVKALYLDLKQKKMHAADIEANTFRFVRAVRTY
jgi:hypothetical protein